MPGAVEQMFGVFNLYSVGQKFGICFFQKVTNINYLLNNDN